MLQHSTSSTDTLRLVITMEQSTPGADTYYPIDGNFIGIDTATMGYNSNTNQIYAKAQLPSAPSADGSYMLSCDVTSGSAALQWASGGGSAPTNMVTTDTAQTITGKKIFSTTGGDYAFESIGSVKFGGANNSFYQLQVFGSQYTSSMKFINYGTGLLIENPTSGIKSVSPVGSSVNLGSTSAIWNNLYVNGDINNGTDSAAVADVIALVAYAKTQGWIQ
jgi:hypothetical protein